MKSKAKKLKEVLAGSAPSIWDALDRWKINSSDISLHALDILDHVAPPTSLSGRLLRSYAQIILDAVDQSPLNTVTLYRGSPQLHRNGIESWSSNMKTAQRFAKESGGFLSVLKPGSVKALKLKSNEDEYIVLANRKNTLIP